MISQWNMSVLSITVICITLVHLSVGVRRGKAGARTKAPAAGPSFDTFSSLITLLDLSPLSHLARLLFNDNLISANMPRSNGETLAWYEDGLLNGKVCEEKFKQESIKFFRLSTKESAKSKQYFKKDVQELVSKHVKMQKCIT